MTLCSGQLHIITLYKTVLGFALFWCWVTLRDPLTNSFIECYFIWWLRLLLGFLWSFYSFWITHLYILWLSSSSSPTTLLPKDSVPGHPFLNIGLNKLSSDSFMSCLDYLLRYSTARSSRLCNWLSSCPCGVCCLGWNTWLLRMGLCLPWEMITYCTCTI